MINLKAVGGRLVQNLKNVIEAVEATETTAVTKSCKITSAEIKDKEAMQRLAFGLPQHGCHIYWLEVDNSEILLKEFVEKQVIEGVRYARDNKSTDNSKYVYVGSCTSTKLGSRWMQHCGHKDPKTYSLQFSKWLQDDKSVFTFNYFEVENELVVQFIEDQLHRELKPLFGKSGGNNRIKKIGL